MLLWLQSGAMSSWCYLNVLQEMCYQHIMEVQELINFNTVFSQKIAHEQREKHLKATLIFSPVMRRSMQAKCVWPSEHRSQATELQFPSHISPYAPGAVINSILCGILYCLMHINFSTAHFAVNSSSMNNSRKCFLLFLPVNVTYTKCEKQDGSSCITTSHPKSSINHFLCHLKHCHICSSIGYNCEI